MPLRLACALFVLASSFIAAAARAETPVPPPVAVVVDGRLLVGTQIGNATLPVFVSRDWSHQLATIHRVIVIVHGYRRDAADYAKMILALKPPPETMVVAPQFLALDDIEPRNVPDHILRWKRETWASGMPAEDPAPQSSFDALDAMSGGARQPYDAAQPDACRARRIFRRWATGSALCRGRQGRGGARSRPGSRLRYVVGSPSSFVYFGGERPHDGAIAAFADAPGCPQYSNWRYGFAGILPPYVAEPRWRPACRRWSAAMPRATCSTWSAAATTIRTTAFSTNRAAPRRKGRTG